MAKHRKFIMHRANLGRIFFLKWTNKLCKQKGSRFLVISEMNFSTKGWDELEQISSLVAGNLEYYKQEKISTLLESPMVDIEDLGENIEFVLS